MDLDYYRTKRQVIKQAIDMKHNEWLAHVSQDDYCELIEAMMRKNISYLYSAMKLTEENIDRIRGNKTIWLDRRVK